MESYTKSLIGDFKNRYKFKIRGMGPILFHLRCDLFHGSNGV